MQINEIGLRSLQAEREAMQRSGEQAMQARRAVERERMKQSSQEQRTVGTAEAFKETQTAQAESVAGDNQFQLPNWLRTTLNAGRNLLKSIWGESKAEAFGSQEESGLQEAGTKSADGRRSGSDDPALRLHGPQVAAAASGIQAPRDMLQPNPYFNVAEDTGRHQVTLREKVKVRFQSIAEYFTRQFSGKNEFQAKQEKPHEDLRRHSRYRQDDLEIDCVLTDDSYLLDSYDKKGEYSKLSAGK